MKIAYINPLQMAWKKMARSLFRPFDITRWMIVGLTAFLAGLADYGGGGTISSRFVGFADFHDFLRLPQLLWEWLMDNPGWLILIVSVSVLIFLLYILFLWLSSRGKFMFLDNVVKNRAEIAKPWHEFKRLGNSLFLWRLFFRLVCIVVFIVLLGQCFIIGSSIYEDRYASTFPVFKIVAMVFLLILMIAAAGYILLFLEDFVVPIMYKKNLSANRSWGVFFQLFLKHPVEFLLYGILVFFLYIIAAVCIVVAALLTCCIGLVLLIVPYIGSVVILPVSYLFRSFSLEFLGQFGEEFKLFTESKK